MTEQATTLSDNIFNLLRQDILDCAFKPGDKLKVEQLKECYDTGATPIREALCKLTSTGYVISEPQRGFTVAKASLEDMRDMYETRMHIDTLTLGLAIDAGHAEWEANILSAFHCMERITPTFKSGVAEDISCWHKRKMNFYEVLMSACPLKNMICVQKLLWERSERYRMLWFYSSADKKSFDESLEAQKQIVDAVLSRDKKKALALLHRHLEHIVEVMSARIAKSSS